MRLNKEQQILTNTQKIMPPVTAMLLRGRIGLLVLAVVLWLVTCGGEMWAKADQFDSLVASAASFDIDSPVEARAEFDPPVAPVGGRVVYRVEVTALDESLSMPENLPAPSGLLLKAGGRGQTFQPTGGMKLRPQTTVIYRMTVTNTGTFTMPSFQLMAYGKPVTVPAVTLNVVPRGEADGAEPPHLIMRAPEGDCYVGQLLHVPLILPTTGEGRVLGLSQPHVTGDFIFAEQFASGIHQEVVQLDGRSVPAFVQEVSVTPLRAGQQELVGQGHGFILRPDAVQTNVMRNVNLLIDSDPVTITVKALPTENVPPGFTGAVGEFQMTPPRLSTNEVRAGEPVKLILTVVGDGNLGRLVPPPLPAMKDWQGFPPIGETLPAALIQQRGFVGFQYTLIPLSEKIRATPVIPFSYFDPLKKAYVSLNVPAIAIKVTAGNATALAEMQSQASTTPDSDFDDPTKREKELVLSGLANTPGVSGSLKPLQQQWWFLALQIVPAGALFGLWSWDRRRRYLELHPEVLLKRRARRGLRRQLRQARHAAAAHDAAGFVAGAANALREACAPHTAANPGALVCADVLQELPVNERQGRAGVGIRQLFVADDALRFGGVVKDGSDLLALQPELERVLEELRARL